MKKIILMGRSECGKTTLTQALKGDVIHYHKTQYINHYDVVIDTLLLSSTEPYSLYPPCVTACCNRPVIGIVTQIDHPDGDPDRAQGWLELAGCHPIFRVSSYTGEGIWQILNYLREPGDILPWDSEQAAERPRVVLSNKYGRLPEEGGGHPQTV